jgi:hypothetical protein
VEIRLSLNMILNKMKNLYGYFFFKLYNLMLKTPGKKTAADAAIKLMCIAQFFYTFPIVIFLIFRIGKFEFWIWAVATLGYGFFLNWLNQSYFIKKDELGRLRKIFSDESKNNNAVGNVVIVVIWLLSPVTFFILLSLI